MSNVKIKVGDIWREKSDGDERKVVGYDSFGLGDNNDRVWLSGTGGISKVWIAESEFLRRFELVSKKPSCVDLDDYLKSMPESGRARISKKAAEIRPDLVVVDDAIEIGDIWVRNDYDLISVRVDGFVGDKVVGKWRDGGRGTVLDFVISMGDLLKSYTLKERQSESLYLDVIKVGDIFTETLSQQRVEVTKIDSADHERPCVWFVWLHSGCGSLANTLDFRRRFVLYKKTPRAVSADNTNNNSKDQDQADAEYITQRIESSDKPIAVDLYNLPDGIVHGSENVLSGDKLISARAKCARHGFVKLPTRKCEINIDEDDIGNIEVVINKAEPRAHNHYFKDVSSYDVIDVYAVCKIFGVQDESGCIQHAIKKLLVAGGRGYKDRLTDLQNAVDTINRLIEIEADNG